MVKKKKIYKDYQELLIEELQDPKLALLYLNEALVDPDQRMFLVALKNVLEAQGGDMTAISKEAQITRPSLYRMLSAKGNPRWSNITSLFNTLGFQVHLSLKK